MAATLDSGVEATGAVCIGKVDIWEIFPAFTDSKDQPECVGDSRFQNAARI
jgi:hypothetical protein